MPITSPTLPPDVFEAVVTAFADTLIRSYRERCAHTVPGAPASSVPSPPSVESGGESSPWLTVPEAAKRARCGRSTIYAAIYAGQLRTARAGRLVRVRIEWVDEWLQGGGSAKT
jgi:excisionase family DNA binding protein